MIIKFKLFEDIGCFGCKFKVGDYIRLSSHSGIYQIRKAHDEYSELRYYLVELGSTYNQGFWIHATEEPYLILVPDFEIDAEKYNL